MESERGGDVRYQMFHCHAGPDIGPVSSPPCLRVVAASPCCRLPLLPCRCPPLASPLRTLVAPVARQPLLPVRQSNSSCLCASCREHVPA